MDQKAFINVLFLCLFNVFLMVVGIFSNSVVLISLTRSSQLRKNLGYFTIFLTSFFDLAVVTFGHPVLMLSTISWFVGSQYQRKFSECAYVVGSILGGFSTSALLTMSVERFLALKYPFFHHTAVTKKRLVLFLALLMFVIAGVAPLLLLWKKFGNFVIIVFISFFFILFMFFNLNIYAIVISKAKVEISRGSPGHEGCKRRRIYFRNISTCAMVVGCFFVCAFPIVMYSVLQSIDAISNQRNARLLRFWAITFANMNSTLNCVIFFWRNSILRREGMKIIKCFRSAISSLS